MIAYPSRPAGFGAILRMLSFSSGEADPRNGLSGLTDSEWRRLLSLCDRMQITLPVARRAKTDWPGWVLERLARNREAGRLRIRRMREALATIDQEFSKRGIDYVLLKGFAHAADYSEDVQEREQFDIDLYTPQDSVQRAVSALVALAYRSVDELEGLQPCHLAPMVTNRDYVWNGDFYDPDIPIAVEPHFCLWDADFECVRAPGLDAIWGRRSRQTMDGQQATVLAPTDELTYRALHALRHLLHGNLKIRHVWELAFFSERYFDDAGVWGTWANSTEPDTRRLVTIAIRVAQEWFGCRLAEVVAAEAAALEKPILLWLARHAGAPLEALSKHNKRELWLHVSLTDCKRRVLLKRLLPARVPVRAEASYAPAGENKGWRRLRNAARYSAYIGSRAAKHIRTLPPAVLEGVGWWWQTAGLDYRFLVFLGTAGLFTFGMFLFVLIYNLYLLALGYQEDFLGLVAGTMTAGSIAGAIPAGWLGRRIGLGRTLTVCFSGSALVCGARAMVTSSPALLVTAFLGGAFLAVWMVSMAPVVARLTTERLRPTGFSLFFGSGIGLGILGGAVGGRLPGWLLASGIAPSEIVSKRAALLAGCAFMALAASAGRNLRSPRQEATSQQVYPSGSFIRRYLAVFALWNLATGAFNPFFNAYLSRLGASMAQIGSAFSLGQIAQLAAMVLAPISYRRFGLVAGIMLMMLLTGAALGGLAAGVTVPAGIVAYCLYMAFQWMSEPGMYSLLMNNVRPEEQSGASSLNFLVVSGAQAVAAAVAGSAFHHYGYGHGLAGAAVVAVAAGLLLHWLLRRFDTGGGSG